MPVKTLRLTTAALLLILSNAIQAQWVSIPDTNLATALYNNGLSQCLQGDNTTGWQMDTTCNAVLTKDFLYLINKNITNLEGIQYLPALHFLSVGLNAISAMPQLQPSITYFDCTEQYDTAFPALLTSAVLPAGLTDLYCGSNYLTTLPLLPPGLQVLRCDYNLLDSLPPLPAGLIQLDVAYNSLTALPALPTTLQYLSCTSNPIATLPLLPATLTNIYCGQTLIQTLPALPDSLLALHVDNTLLTCLPELKYIQDLTFQGTNVTCLPNYPSGTVTSIPALSSVPLCNYFNSNGCSVFWNITGKDYEDTNADCINDAGESYLRNIPMQLWQNGNLLKQSSSSQGFFSFDVYNYGTYQTAIDSNAIPFSVLCPANGSLTSVISAADSMDYNMDFALVCKPGFDLEARSIAAPMIFQPANFNTVEIGAGDATSFYNGHCAAGTAGNVTLSYTGPAKYISPANGALTPTAVSNNTLTWNIPDFGIVNFTEDFDIIMQTDTFAQMGQQICFTLTASPVINDNNPANNTFSICFPVLTSFDPNDKQAYPAGNIDTLQEDLVYTVRFQNTGNAPAQHIYITDTLDLNVRPETFELLAYSHQLLVQIDGNAMRFNFPNINLPDSFSNEPQSHGYVQYRVKLKENLPVGAVINNTAFIYFDFNAPVITNTTTNTVSVEVDTTVGIRPVKNTTEVFVFPNPANKAVTITVSESMSNATVTVTDLLGRKAIDPVWLNNTRSISLNTQHLSEGVYIVNVTSKAGTTLTRRLVINH